MKNAVPHCPSCGILSSGGNRFYIKKGYYRTKWNRQMVPRYKCKTCGVLFSSHTFLKTYKQKKPHFNLPILKWYSSSATQRRMARVLGINRKTVVRKFLFMAKAARAEHERQISTGQIKTSFVQFDEVETFEHTRLKPVSVTVAVRVKTGEIIEAKVATMNCHGHMAKLSQEKYGWRENNQDVAREAVFQKIMACSRDRLTIYSDAQNAYPAIAKKIVPHADFQTFKSIRAKLKTGNRRNKDDKLFAINLLAAKLRHDLSRMARKSWVTTKQIDRLQAHLDLYIAFNNGYKLAG